MIKGKQDKIMKYELAIIVPIYLSIIVMDNFGDTIWKYVLIAVLAGISIFSALKWIMLCEKNGIRK